MFFFAKNIRNFVTVCMIILSILLNSGILNRFFDNPKIYITLIVLLLSIFFFIRGKIRSDLVALCVPVALMLFSILTPREALSGFSSTTVIMMIGVFVVGGGIFRTGLTNIICRKILGLAGNSQTKLFVLIMLVTSAIGGFVSNTGTVAMMLPIVVGLAMAADANPSRFLMPLAFASSMGGMLTLIGTPPNLEINRTLREAAHSAAEKSLLEGIPNPFIENGWIDGLEFFSFAPIGLICITIGILTLGPLSKLFLMKEKDVEKSKKSKSLKDLANEYQLSDNLFRVRVLDKSLITGNRLQELEIPKRYNINILEIRRRSNSQNPFLKTIDQQLAGPETILELDDVLYLSGSPENVLLFSIENKTELIDTHKSEEKPSVTKDELRFDKIGIAEVVLLSNSRLIGHPVKASGFREKYRVNILGIQRKQNYILKDLKDEKMYSGDVLLVQGEWNDIAKLTVESSEWVVIGQPLVEASKVTIDHKAPVAATILIAMVAMMVAFPKFDVAAVIMAALAMIFTGCFKNAEEAYKTINWESIVLIGAMLSMSAAIVKTGAADILSQGLAGLGVYGPRVVMLGIYAATSILTLFISNTATAALFAPIALSAALAINANPVPFLMAVTVAASMCFASPFSTPPNALVMSAGRYTFMDYVKVGLPLQIFYGLVMIIVLPLLWKF